MSGNSKIEDVRHRIDRLDEEILRLVNDRIKCAKEIGAARSNASEDGMYRPEREAQILNRLTELNSGPLESAQLQTIFSEVISVARAAESIPRLSLLGPAGTYSQVAALKHFGQQVKTVFATDIEEVFRLVETGQADHGVVPVENSTEGGISSTLDCLVTTPLRICGEISIRVSHSLVGHRANRTSAEAILGHEQALAQCRNWLNRNLPGLRKVPVSSNAEAVRRVRDDSTSLAIAGGEAAKIYNLEVLEQGIEDQPGNTTRFFVVGNQAIEASGRDKTSLAISSRNRAGSLQRLLAPLADNSISMTRIESRPSRTGIWEYVFFIDFQGHVTDLAVTKALSEIESEAALFRVLGSYPQAI